MSWKMASPPIFLNTYFKGNIVNFQFSFLIFCVFKSPVFAFFLLVGFDFWAFAFFSAPLRVAKPCFLPLFSIIAKTLQQEVPAWNEAVVAHLCIQKSAQCTTHMLAFQVADMISTVLSVVTCKNLVQSVKKRRLRRPVRLFCGFCCALRKPAEMHERIGLAILKRFLFRRFSEKNK